MDWLLHLELNSRLGIYLYWLPMAINAYGYVVRTWNNYQKDVKARETKEHYSPTDTVGSLLGRAICTLIPGINLLASVFDVGPGFLSWLDKFCGWPLVPRRNK